MEKKQYEKPEVTKVDFKFEEAIAASGCTKSFSYKYGGSGSDQCENN